MTRHWRRHRHSSSTAVAAHIWHMTYTILPCQEGSQDSRFKTFNSTGSFSTRPHNAYLFFIISVWSLVYSLSLSPSDWLWPLSLPPSLSLSLSLPLSLFYFFFQIWNESPNSQVTRSRLVVCNMQKAWGYHCATGAGRRGVPATEHFLVTKKIVNCPSLE